MWDGTCFSTQKGDILGLFRALLNANLLRLGHWDIMASDRLRLNLQNLWEAPKQKRAIYGIPHRSLGHSEDEKIRIPHPDRNPRDGNLHHGFDLSLTGALS
jgi:hypothetical protein